MPSPSRVPHHARARSFHSELASEDHDEAQRARMCMTAVLSLDPDGPRKGVEQKAKLLEVLPSARVVLISLIVSSQGEFNLPLVLSGEVLDRLRPVLIEEALKGHARAEEILAEYQGRRVVSD